MIKARSFHFVLINNTSGNHASRPDRTRLAMLLRANELQRMGQAGGIVDILTEQAAKESQTLVDIIGKYRIEQVFARNGRNGHLPARLTARRAVLDDEIVCKLAVLFEAHGEPPFSPHCRSAKAFIGWLQAQMADRLSMTYAILTRSAPDLLAAPRGDRWWSDQISQRRKRRVKLTSAQAVHIGAPYPTEPQYVPHCIKD